MKHVFHIITHLDIGGAERVAIDIASVKSEDYKFHIIEVVNSDSSIKKSLEKEIEVNRIQFHKSPYKNSKIAILLFAFRLNKIINKYNPVIIHSHTEIPDLSLYLSNFLFQKNLRGIGIVRTIHNTRLWSSWKWIGNLVEKYFIKMKANVAISNSVKDGYESVYNSTVDYTVYNGVVEKKKKQFKLCNPEKINILFSGRFEYQKGIDELIQVLTLYKNSKTFDFYIIGSGSMVSDVLDKVRGFSNVFYKEGIFDLSSYLGSFDYLFMPSNFEGLGLVSIEASLSSVPTIMNDIPGLSETLPSDWPLKVMGNRVDAYEKIFKLAHKRDDLGKVAYNFVKTKFAVEKMQNKYLKIYELSFKDDNFVDS